MPVDYPGEELMRKSSVTAVISLLSFLLVTSIYPTSRVHADSAGLELTALDRYVRAPDSNYKYSVINTVHGDGYTTFIVDMTSQKWLTEVEVNLPIWEHFMTITRPDTVSSDIGFLYITGGSKSSSVPQSAPAMDINRALLTNTVGTTLYMVPNQPLIFVGDETKPRSEDSAIAYTWDKFLRTGDDKWPMRLPMTKSAVRAMDTVTDLMASAQGGSIEVDQFVVAGGSKRGWTTWTTAVVDKRVIAIAPIVIDMLNVEESFKHHFQVYGHYALAVVDYVGTGVMDWMGTQEFHELIDCILILEVDPEPTKCPLFLVLMVRHTGPLRERVINVIGRGQEIERLGLP